MEMLQVYYYYIHHFKLASFSILALAPDDYTTLAIPVNRPNYLRNNVLNFRGGTREDRELSFDITINRDISLPRDIFYLNINLVTNAIVLTPQMEIKGETIIIINFNFALFSALLFPSAGGCPLLTAPVNGMVQISGYAPGSTATFSCDSGNQSILTCTDMCKWDHEPPMCGKPED